MTYMISDFIHTIFLNETLNVLKQLFLKLVRIVHENHIVLCAENESIAFFGFHTFSSLLCRDKRSLED